MLILAQVCDERLYVETAIVRSVLRVGEEIITSGVKNAPLLVGGNRGARATEVIARPEPYFNKDLLKRWVYSYLTNFACLAEGAPLSNSTASLP